MIGRGGGRERERSCWVYLTILPLLVVSCYCIKRISIHIPTSDPHLPLLSGRYGAVQGMCSDCKYLTKKQITIVWFMLKLKWMWLSDDHAAERTGRDRYLCQLWTSGECDLCFALQTAKVCSRLFSSGRGSVQGMACKDMFFSRVVSKLGRLAWN